jgi:hypothetical protein
VRNQIWISASLLCVYFSMIFCVSLSFYTNPDEIYWKIRSRRAIPIPISFISKTTNRMWTRDFTTESFVWSDLHVWCLKFYNRFSRRERYSRVEEVLPLNSNRPIHFPFTPNYVTVINTFITEISYHWKIPPFYTTLSKFHTSLNFTICLSQIILYFHLLIGCLRAGIAQSV